MSDDLAIALAATFGLVMFSLLAVGGVLVIRDTMRKRGRWGMNFAPVRCPRCGEPAPVVRAPKNSRQALWGGHTCAKCGVEYDKWGHEVTDEFGNEDRQENT
jgi:hypothetical protein